MNTQDVLEAVLLFHSNCEWTPDVRSEWMVLTGREEATTKALCDSVREALKAVPKRTPADTIIGIVAEREAFKAQRDDALEKLSGLIVALRSALPLIQRDANRDHGDQQLTSAAEDRLIRARAAIAKAEGK